MKITREHAERVAEDIFVQTQTDFAASTAIPWITDRLLAFAAELQGKQSAAVALGSRRSAKKAAAAKVNGRKGGRPRKEKP
jgi:hypothetical protein